MDETDIHQLNLIMEVLGTPAQEFMSKISSESVSIVACIHCLSQVMWCNVRCKYYYVLSVLSDVAWPLTRLYWCYCVVSINGLCKFGACVTLTCVYSDIDHLTRILFLCGRPDQETIDKIISEEVRKLIF